MGRLEWGLLGLLVLALAADWWWRLRPEPAVSGAAVAGAGQDWAELRRPPPPSTESVVPDLLGDPLPTPTPVVLDSPEDGQVSEWFRAGRRLRLEAVFRRGERRIAVIVGDDGKGKDLRREQLQQGDRLADHVVVRIDRQAIRLVREDRLLPDGSPPPEGGLELILFKRGRGAVRLRGET